MGFSLHLVEIIVYLQVSDTLFKYLNCRGIYCQRLILMNFLHKRR